MSPEPSDLACSLATRFSLLLDATRALQASGLTLSVSRPIHGNPDLYARCVKLMLVSNGKVLANEQEQTSVENIYAIGDVLDDKPELTPVAIQAGLLLARRLYGNATLTTDYANICTTVFTPLEYGCCGLSEDDALEQYGDDLEVYHQSFTPLEWTVPHRPENICFAKILTLKSQVRRLILSHFFCIIDPLHT